jgi:hypothetical protein
MRHDGTHLADIIMYFTSGILRKNKIEGNIVKGKGTAFFMGHAKSKKIGKIPVSIHCGAQRDYLTFALELSFESGSIKVGNGIYEEWKSEKSPYYTGFNSLAATEKPMFEKTAYFENMVKDAVKFLSSLKI